MILLIKSQFSINSATMAITWSNSVPKKASLIIFMEGVKYSGKSIIHILFDFSLYHFAEFKSDLYIVQTLYLADGYNFFEFL